MTIEQIKFKSESNDSVEEISKESRLERNARLMALLREVLTKFPNWDLDIASISGLCLEEGLQKLLDLSLLMTSLARESFLKRNGGKVDTNLASDNNIGKLLRIETFCSGNAEIELTNKLIEFFDLVSEAAASLHLYTTYRIGRKTDQRLSERETVLRSFSEDEIDPESVRDKNSNETWDVQDTLDVIRRVKSGKSKLVPKHPYRPNKHKRPHHNKK